MISKIITGIIEVSNFLDLNSLVVFIVYGPFDEPILLQVLAKYINPGLFEESALFS
jgi:hypothetical protein